MNNKELITDYLERQPLFRERRNKDQGIINLLMGTYPDLRRVIKEGLIKKETIVAIVQSYASMDRQWRQVLERTPHLRGKDYADKVELEEKALEKLGYLQP